MSIHLLKIHVYLDILNLKIPTDNLKQNKNMVSQIQNIFFSIFKMIQFTTILFRWKQRTMVPTGIFRFIKKTKATKKKKHLLIGVDAKYKKRKKSF